MAQDVVSGEGPPHPQVAESSPRPAARSSAAVWALAMLVATGLAAVVPLYFRHRFYFADDTQTGAFGQWYHLGTSLLHGQWPLLSLDHWRSGNYVVEGQWGLWNPVVLLIAVLAAKASNAVLFCTVLKIATLVLAAGGGFLLMRSYGTRASSAALGGLAITLTGFTVYMDAAAWVTGLMTWALWPYLWWGVRRAALEGKSPWPALVAGYLIVTVGYVHATLMVAVVLAACLVEAVFVRRWRAAAVIAATGVLIGMVVFTVFLPGLLSLGVTDRASFVGTGSLLTTNGGDFLTAALPVGARSMRLFDQRLAMAPLSYVTWFLPLLFLVDYSRLRRRNGELVGVGLTLGASVFLVLLPATFGPLRFPTRVYPYVATCVILLAVIALDRGLMVRPGRRRGAYAVLAAGLPAYLSVVQAPTHWKVPVAGAVMVGALVLGVWVWSQRAESTGPFRFGHDRLMVALVMATLAVTVVQHRLAPASPLPDWHLPAQVAAYEKVGPGMRGDTMLVGKPVPIRRSGGRGPAATWRDMLVANAWYVGADNVQNTYTPVGFKAYSQRFCMAYTGATCRRALPTLFRHPRGVPVPRADLMSVSTVLVSKRGGGASLHVVPPGWHVAARNPTDTVWVRNTPLPRAGGVTYTSRGVQVSAVHWDDQTTTFHVDKAPTDGSGRVVLSRLPWPGYRVTNARLAAPVDGYLLTADVPASSVGKTVTVHYQVPGWRIGTTLGGLAVAAGAAWVLALGLLSRVRRRRPGTW